MRVFWSWPWPAQRWLDVAEGVASVGHRLTVQCFAEASDEPLPVPSAGVTLLPELPRPRPRVERSAAWAADRVLLVGDRARLRAWRLRTVGTDVCHLHLLQHLLDPVLLARIQRRHTLISTVHDLRPHHSRLPRPVEHAALRRLYATAGHLVVHHPVLADGLVEEFGVDRERITVLLYPVLSAPPAPTGRPDSTGSRVLCFGALRRNKGIAVLLEAMAMPSAADLRLTIAGRGAPEVEVMVREAAERDPRITAHLGYISEEQKGDLYRAADLVVLPYTAFASQSAVLHDAYAYRRPVVVTDVGALGSTVRADRTGWVVPPSDAEALADCLTSALGDQEGLRAAARAGAAVAEERSPHAVGGRLASLYEHLTGLGPSEEHRPVAPRALEVERWGSSS